MEGGAADKDGMLKVGDRLVTVSSSFHLFISLLI